MRVNRLPSRGEGEFAGPRLAKNLRHTDLHMIGQVNGQAKKENAVATEEHTNAVGYREDSAEEFGARHHQRVYAVTGELLALHSPLP